MAKLIIANDFQVKTGSTPAWTTLGKGMKFKWTRKDKTGAITYVDGEEELFKAGEQRTIRIEVSDQDLATLQKHEALSGELKPLYFNLGKEKGKGQDLYIPAGRIFLDTEYESPSTGGLTNGLIIQMEKQTSLVAINPSTGLPTTCWAAAINETKTSFNYHYLLIET